MVSGIILASGFSRRMGTEKLLLPIGSRPLVENVVQAALSSGLQETILVYRRDIIRQQTSSYQVRHIYNPNAHQGQSAAIKAGVQAALPDATAYLFMVADQPFLSSGIIDFILSFHTDTPHCIIVPTYTKIQGNPVLFPVQYRSDLLSITGDKGGRDIIRDNQESVQYIETGQRTAGIDLDNIEEYQKILHINTQKPCR